MRVLFHVSKLIYRGGALSRISLAAAYGQLDGNTAYLAFPKMSGNEMGILDEYSSSMNWIEYSSKEELDDFIESNDIDVVFYAVHGQGDVLPTEIRPTVVQAVFSTRERKGTVFVSLSEYLNRKCRTSYDVLPLIPTQFRGRQESMREALMIPPDAIVFGSISGRGMFNIPFVKDVVEEIAKERSDIVFLFAGIEPFSDCDRLIYVDQLKSLDDKEQFINTCDFMLHARGDGETFGMACAEFAAKNKKVYTWKPRFIHRIAHVFAAIIHKIGFDSSRFRFNGVNIRESYAMAHLDYLGEDAVVYSSRSDLKRLICASRKSSNTDSNSAYIRIFKPSYVCAELTRHIRRAYEIGHAASCTRGNRADD